MDLLASGGQNRSFAPLKGLNEKGKMAIGTRSAGVNAWARENGAKRKMEPDSLPTAEKKQAQAPLVSVQSAVALLAHAPGGHRHELACRDDAESAEAEGGGRGNREGGRRGDDEPTWLGKLLRDDSLVKVTDVQLSGESATDAALVHLQELTQLQGLLLYNTEVTDAGLVHLQGLSQLQRLGTTQHEGHRRRVVESREGLSQLPGGLWSSAPQVTDAGLAASPRVESTPDAGSSVGMTSRPMRGWCIFKG